MRRHTVFGTVSLGLLLHSMSSFAAAVALSRIVTDLNTTIVLAGWVLSVYSLVFTFVMPLAGKVSERLGIKTTFILCTVLFTTGSAFSAVAPNIYLLVGARALQAMGAGGFMPCASGIVSETFPEARQKYIGLFSSILPIGMVIGPNMGGWLTEVFGWRSIFWFNIPFGIAVLALAVMLLPNLKKKTASSVDFIGAGLLFGLLFTFMIGLTQLGAGESGVPWGLVTVMFALSAGFLISFWRWERRAPEPVIHFDLLSKGPFLAANIHNLIYGICILGVLSLIPLYAVSVYGMSVLESGVLMTPRSLTMIAASAITSFSLLKWGYRKPILAGTLLVALGLALLALQPRGISVLGIGIGTPVLLYVIVGLSGIGHGVCTPASNNACIELMPDRVAAIMGLRGMFRQLGSTVGVNIAMLTLYVVGDPGRAFAVVLFASAAIMLVSIPAVFRMPASPGVTGPGKIKLAVH
ncbi:MAG: MFS transporter [Chloroflexi bacterium]|nr:MFS transporter [Chloroflexota bacterium]